MSSVKWITMAILGIAILLFANFNGSSAVESNSSNRVISTADTLDKAAMIAAYKDSVRPVVMMLAAQSQGYRMKNDSSFTGISFNEVKFNADTVSSDGLKAITSHGLFVISDRSKKGFTLSIHLKPMIEDALNFNSSAPEPLQARVSADQLDWINLVEADK